VLLCGAFALIGAWSISYQLGAELLNFGAFLAFIGVNAAAFKHYWWNGHDRSWSQGLIPVCAIGVCLWIWLGLRPQAKCVGLAWIVIGAVYYLGRGIMSRRRVSV
jgi:hypothetical protein